MSAGRDYKLPHLSRPLTKAHSQSAISVYEQTDLWRNRTTGRPSHSHWDSFIELYWSRDARMALMKSGYLWRQSSVLHRWKKSWVDIWMDGNLVYYQDESRKDYEGRIHLKQKCTAVRVGQECADVQPPEGMTRDCLLMVCVKGGCNLTLCANSADEALAWKLTLQEARKNPVYVYDPYEDSYHTVPLDGHNAVYISPGHGYLGPHHVVVHQEPCFSMGEQVALGMLAGMATGAALRSLMWMPFWI
ncbi:pleckstrin homology domain-containing family B member 1 [Erpetoichthys calabaricus]|uniref:pleckstrin homology domain-containing family B member 1 n=1 Tax=Erpetoichthys calabaricus TaxID=27687 RepID=UPI002234880A|nr:pleckstrin homology domain-containing family B member 1 [Erpetoichthys calabaricus]